MNKQETISKVFCEIMENTVFMFGDEEDKADLAEATGETIKTEIGFNGPIKGSLTIIAPISACQEMAVNLLGVATEDELTSEQPIDAVKEVANIVIGNILTEIAGTEPVFDLTIPEVVASNKEEWDKMIDDDNVIGFDFDDEAILLDLKIID